MTVFDGVLMSAMKSGSTWLKSVMASHPEIQVCQGQDAPILADGSIDIRCKTDPAARRFLLRRNLKREDRYLIAYRQHNPELQFIVLLRDPVERIYSQYVHEVRKWYPSRQLRALRAPHRRTLRSVVYDFDRSVASALEGDGPLPDFIAKSLYYNCLRPYLDVFGDNRFFIRALEQVERDPESFFLDVSRFLGVSNSGYEGARARVNPRRKPRSSFVRRRITVTPMSDDTRTILAHFVIADARQIENRLGVPLLKSWDRTAGEASERL